MFAIVLIIALMFNCSAIGISATENTVLSEADAAPVVFDAVSQYNTASASTGPFWYYQYSSSYSEPQWNYCTRYSWNYWMSPSTAACGYTGISYQGKMQVRNISNQINSKLPSTAYLFVPDESGYIDMRGTASLASRPSTEYNAMVRITCNGENVYPSTGWITLGTDITSFSFDGIEFYVEAGDQVRFEMTTDNYLANSALVSVNWNPMFYYAVYKPAYTQQEGILGKLTQYMASFFGGLTSSTMDADSTDAEASALAKVTKSKGGLYTPLDAVYGSKLLTSDNNSVWKFAVSTYCGKGFETPNTDFSVSVTYAQEALNVSWDNTVSAGTQSVRTVNQEGQINDYTVSGSSVSLAGISVGDQIKLQVKSENYYSEVITVSVNEDGTLTIEEYTSDTRYYLNTVTASSTSSASAKLNITNTSVSSQYNMYYSTAQAGSETPINRRILYSSALGEKMNFGFTAPYGGEYEISTPISVEGTGEVSYWVTKQAADGTITRISNAKSDYSDGSFCLLQESLSVGDTVWFEAAGDVGTVINIGIPYISLCTSTTDSEGTKKYVYRAVDYMENRTKNEYTYKTSSWIENRYAAWDFGYFNNPVVTEGEAVNYDSLGLAAYDIGTDASAVCGLLKPYELIRGGQIYNTLPISLRSSTSIVTGTYGVIGNLYPSLGNTYNDRQKLGELYKSKGLFGCTGTAVNQITQETLNIGIYMKYTAPISGNAVLHISEDAAAYAGDRLLIVKNGTVVAKYSGTVSAGTDISLGNLNKGDTVVMLYAKLQSGRHYHYFGMPIMEVSKSSENAATEVN